MEHVQPDTQTNTTEHEAIAQAVLQNAVDGIISIDEQGTIVFFNPAAERLFGYRRQEVAGRNVSMLMPSPHREAHDGYVRRYLETGVQNVVGCERGVVGLRRDGTTFPLELSVSEVQAGGRRIFTAILRDITTRRELEAELVTIVEQERRRMGQEFHDGLGQKLGSIALRASILVHRLAQRGAEEAGEARRLAAQVNEAVEQTRRLSHGLFPARLKRSGLNGALGEIARQVEADAGVTCILRYDADGVSFDDATALHLYRITQEAVSNAVRHGRASTIEVAVSRSDRLVTLCVRDDGVGIPDRLPASSGIGLRSMHCRAELIGASLDVARRPSGGTEVLCRLHRFDAPESADRPSRTNPVAGRADGRA